MSAGRVMHTGERDRMRYCGEGVTEDELGNNLLKHIKDGLGRARGPEGRRGFGIGSTKEGTWG